MPSIAELAGREQTSSRNIRGLPGNTLSTRSGPLNTLTNMASPARSGFAAPAVSYALGQGAAQQGQAAGRETQISEFFLLFSKMARTDKGVAVKFWNANAEDVFGEEYKIDTIKTDPQGTTVRLVESGDFVRMSPEGIQLWDKDEQGQPAWRQATEQDIARIGQAKKTLKTIGRRSSKTAGDKTEANIQKLDAEIGKIDRLLSGLDPAAKRMNKQDIDKARKRRDELKIEREALRLKSGTRKDVNLQPGSDAALGGRFSGQPQQQPARGGGLPPLLPY